MNGFCWGGPGMSREDQERSNEGDEMRQWQTGGPHMYALAQNLIRWINGQGGQARYQYSAKPETLGCIRVMTPDGERVAYAGDFVGVRSVAAVEHLSGNDGGSVDMLADHVAGLIVRAEL